jgi:phage baseplate assembly protein W
MKQGTDRVTGKTLTGTPYLRQRLADVINTPLGSVVGARDFGSRIFEMVDHNVDRRFYMNVYVRLAESINNPANGLEDFKLSEMTVESLGNNQLEFKIIGNALIDGKPIEFQGIIYE